MVEEGIRLCFIKTMDMTIIDFCGAQFAASPEKFSVGQGQDKDKEEGTVEVSEHYVLLIGKHRPSLFPKYQFPGDSSACSVEKMISSEDFDGIASFSLSTFIDRGTRIAQ